MSTPRVLAGRYQLHEVLGVGGMGRVHRAWDLTLSRPVAVKVLRTELLDTDTSGNSIERFRREARIVAGFDHPGIVHVYDMGQVELDEQTTHFLVMQLVNGRTLLKSHRHTALPPDRLIEVIGDVLAALHHAHERGVVHRDVKPSNVMLTDSGAVKVMDFGIAHLKGAEHTLSLTGTGNIVGTVAYLAPEQAQDSRKVDARSDVYSVGCMLYHLLTDQLPFPGSTPWEILAGHIEHRLQPPSAVAPWLGPHFDAVLERALAVDPVERYPSAAAMRDDLFDLRLQLPDIDALHPPEPDEDSTEPDIAGTSDAPASAGTSTRQIPPPTPLAAPVEPVAPVEEAAPAEESEAPPQPPRRPSRRAVLAGLGGAAVLVAGGSAAFVMASSDPADVVKPHGNPGAVWWKSHAGSMIILSTPTVADGRVYIAGYDTNVYALDARTGVTRWKAPTGDRVRPSPAVIDGLVAVAGWDGSVYAFDSKTGSQRWKTPTGDQGASFPVSPAVADGAVYVSTTDWYVLALDGASGALRWRTQTRGAANSAAAVAGGVVYLGTDGYVYALDAATGTVRWKTAGGGPVWSSPAVSNGVVYLGNEDFSVYALAADTGEIRWKTATADRVYSSPVVVDGLVVVGSYDKNVYGLDAASGEVRWKTPTGDRVYSSPTAADNAVYVGSWDGFLYAIEAQTGKLRWKTPLGGPVWSSPTVADKVVYVGSADGMIYAVDA
nr:PQQ-binding-like beta-propeller repeat protein [Antrihabitans stalactiti]